MQKQLHHTSNPSYMHPRTSLIHGATPHTLASIPGLGGGADFPAETGRARQGHVQLGHQHHHLRPLHEAQTVVHAHAQAALQDLQRAAVQRNAPLGKHRARRVSPWAEGQRLPGKRQAERRNCNGRPRHFRIRGRPEKCVPASDRQLQEPLASGHFLGCCGFPHKARPSLGYPPQHALPPGVGSPQTRAQVATAEHNSQEAANVSHQCRSPQPEAPLPAPRLRLRRKLRAEGAAGRGSVWTQ